MLQHRQIRVHEPFNTVRHARFFPAGQLAGRYRARDALLETCLAQVVDRFSSECQHLSFRTCDGTIIEGKQPTFLHLGLLSFICKELL